MDLYLFVLQPSELMKLAMPLMLAWYLDEKRLPPDTKTLGVCSLIIAIPTLLVLIEPDMGTASAARGSFLGAMGGDWEAHWASATAHTENKCWAPEFTQMFGRRHWGV